MKLRFVSMTAGLAVGVTAAVLLASAGGAYLYSKHHMRSLLATAQTTALAEGNLIRVALEHQMIENDRTLIASMIDSFRKQERVERLVLLDRFGKQQYPRVAREPAEDFREDSAGQGGSSRIVETIDGTVLRTVVPVRNRQECHGCHDPTQKINGILILDYKAEELRAEMNRDLGWLVAGTAGITMLLVGAIAIVIRFAVMKRLQRFETAARQIAAGDLGRRIPAEGSDTLSWLAREFNTMADSVTGLVGEVRNQRERLETVINSIDDGIVVLDAQRNILAANDAFLHRVEHSREEVLGRSCRHMTSGGCKVADCPTVACLDAGARQVRICERPTANGVAWEEVHASPIRNGSGELLQVVEVWRDISERRAAEAHLSESHRLASLGTLASGFSHELNTPLATVLTCVEGIMREFAAPLDGRPDQEHIRESATIAREQVLRCRGITQHFLRMARGQRSQSDIVDVQAIVSAVTRVIEPTAREHSVKIDVQPIDPIHVRVDEAELQHTLINLLLNAIQASKPGGKVAVTVTMDNAVHIRISDNGCGIAPENHKRIFEPFFSLREGGTGLGLFLSLNFVRRWGGDVVLESTVGQGSAFEVILPLLTPAGVEAAR
jgi:PAS domain S-box-containing protein